MNPYGEQVATSMFSLAGLADEYAAAPSFPRSVATSIGSAPWEDSLLYSAPSHTNTPRSGRPLQSTVLPSMKTGRLTEGFSTVASQDPSPSFHNFGSCRSLPLTLATSSPLDYPGGDHSEGRSMTLGQHMSVPHPQAQLLHPKSPPLDMMRQDEDDEDVGNRCDLMMSTHTKSTVTQSKHPASAYVFYVAECRARLQKTRPDLSFAGIARIIGASWQKLTPEDREKYNRMAEDNKARYQLDSSLSSQMDDMPKRRKRDPNAPKHPVSAYLFFVAESRSSLCKEYPDMSFGEMAKFIGSKWKALTPEQRKKYSDLASEDKQRYEKQLSTYVKPAQPEGIVEQPSKRRKRSANAPKHPVSAYLFYVAEQRRDLTTRQPGKTFKEMATFIGKKWKNLTTEERTPYTEQAARDKERYEREKAQAAAMVMSLGDHES